MKLSFGNSTFQTKLLIVLVVSFASLTPLPVFAQRGGVMMKSIVLVTDLLEYEKVQKELQMADSQATQLCKEAKELSEQMRAEIREALLVGDDIDELREGFLKQDAKILAQLNESQQKRLQQLHYQRLGVGLLDNEDIQQRLALTEDQLAKVAKSRKDIQEKAQSLAQSGEFFRDGQEKVNERLLALSKEREEVIMKILTSEQQKQLEELKGQTFEFPKEMSAWKTR